MADLSRRTLLHLGAGGVAGAYTLSSVLGPPVPTFRRAVELTATGAPPAPPAPSLGPAVFPVPATSPLGIGKARAIAFGSGGEWFTFWTLAYCMQAKNQGVDLEDVDLTIGTSAGGIMGSFVAPEQ